MVHSPAVFRRLALLFLPLVAAIAIRAADPTAANPLLTGSLPNGLRYAVLPRSGEPGRVSLRLIVHAGSLDEHDDERGLAHFVEHMAFNGTTHYPPGRLVSFFQRIGIAFGADANAETSFTSTIYRIDLPAQHAAHLPEALRVLADFAGGIDFAPAEVRRERDVILSELRARDNDEWQIRLQEIAVFYSGTTLPGRLPIGDPATIARAEAPTLRRFYERCYRPERMTLLVVGDVEPAALNSLVVENFGRLRGHGPAIAQILPSPLSRPQLDPAVITTPLAKAATVTLIAIDPVTADTPDAIRAMLGNALVISALNHRLDERRAALSARIGRAEGFAYDGLDRRYLHRGLVADTRQQDWADAVALLETELRRARETGFSTGEIKEVSAALLATLRAQLAGFPGEPADRLANNIAPILAARRGWHGPDELLSLAENYFAAFDPTAAAERLRTSLSDGQLRLVLTTRTPPPDGAAAVLAAWRASAAQPLAALAAHPADELSFHYEDFGAPGAVAERRTDVPLGLELLHFANGVRLNLRPNPVEPHRFRLWARLGRGTPDIPRDQPGINLVAIALLSQSDLGRHTREELRRVIALRAVEGNWSFDENDFIIQLTGPSDQLPFALKALTASIADVKLEPAKMAEAATSVYPALVGSLLNSTAGFSKVETLFRAAGEDPRLRLPSAAEVRPYSFEAVTTWLRAHALEGPLEIGIAGDFAVADAVSAAAASVATLAPRHAPPSLPGEQIHLATKTYRNLVLIDLPDRAANVRVYWPIPDAADLRVCRALRLGLSALEDRLRLKLREQLGVTYSPGSGIYRSTEQPNLGLALIELTFPPDRAQKLAESVMKLSDDFGRKGLTAEEFSRLREPLRAGALAELRLNEWWLANVLIRAQSQPGVLAEARTHGAAFDDLTRAEVNRALAAHLTAATVNCLGFIPRASPPPSAQAASSSPPPRPSASN